MRLFCFALAVLLLGNPAWAAQEGPAVIATGTWGPGPGQLGLVFDSPGVLPHGPFRGPGGLAAQGTEGLWVSDSVNSRLVYLPFDGSPCRYLPVEGTGLGAISWAGEAIACCIREPAGIGVFDRHGARLAFFPVAWKTPGRLVALSSATFLVEDQGAGGTWWVAESGTFHHPAPVLEAVSDGARWFGTQFDLQDDARTLVAAPMQREPAEPEVVAVFRRPGRRIVYSRILGLIGDNPVFLALFADAPGIYHLVRFSPNGTEGECRRIQVSAGPGMAAPFILERTGDVYVLSGNAQGFTLARDRWEDLPVVDR